MRSFNNHKTMVLADQAIFSGSGFLMTLLIARHLSVSEFGAYSAIILLVYLAINAIGSWTIHVFQVSPEKNISYISFLFILQFLLAAVIAIAFMVICHFLPIDYLPTAMIFGFGFVMYDFSRKILLALDKTMETLFLDIINSILLLLVFLIFKYQGSKNMNVLLIYLFIPYSISLFYTCYIVKPFKYDFEQAKVYLASHLQQGKWLFLTSISQWWAGNLFVMASGLYLGSAALGALRLGQSLFGFLNVLLQVFENYILPKSAIKMQLNQQLGIGYLKEMNQKLAIIFIPILIVIFLWAAPILRIAGGQNYSQYAYVLKGLSLLYLFILLSQPIRFFLRSNQMNDHFFFAYLINLAFAICSSHWLITTFGLHGVIAGLIMSQLILVIYWTIILQLKNINIWKSSTSY